MRDLNEIEWAFRRINIDSEYEGEKFDKNIHQTVR